jgi:hypothetical protein
VDPIAGFAARRWLGRDPTPSAASMATWSARLGDACGGVADGGLSGLGGNRDFISGDFVRSSTI